MPSDFAGRILRLSVMIDEAVDQLSDFADFFPYFDGRQWNEEESDGELASRAQRATQSRKTNAERVGFEIDIETCAICLDQPCEPTVLPCGHTFCGGCVDKLRKTYGEERRPYHQQSCPTCRAELPPDGKRLTDKAIEIYSGVDARVQQGEASGSWMDVEQHRPEKDNVVAMLTEAVATKYPALDAEAQVGDGDDAHLHYTIGYLQETEREDYDGAKASYLRAIALDWNYTMAHFRLGLLLERERDVDGAMVEYKVTVRLDPGHADAQVKLADLLNVTSTRSAVSYCTAIVVPNSGTSH